MVYNAFALTRKAPKCMGGWEAAKDRGSFRLQNSQGRSYW